jgi:hypothetical protein
MGLRDALYNSTYPHKQRREGEDVMLLEARMCAVKMSHDQHDCQDYCTR